MDLPLIYRFTLVYHYEPSQFHDLPSQFHDLPLYIYHYDHYSGKSSGMIYRFTLVTHTIVVNIVVNHEVAMVNQVAAPCAPDLPSLKFEKFTFWDYCFPIHFEIDHFQ
jgi:hypothetical protein